MGNKENGKMKKGVLALLIFAVLGAVAVFIIKEHQE